MLGELLAPVGRFLRWIGGLIPDAPYVRIILWTMLIAVLLWICWLLYSYFSPRYRGGRADRETTEEQPFDAAPDVTTARAWLAEADALAGEGRYGDAVHHLLIKSIDDINRRRPQIMRPALTSRDIAAASGIPAVPRALFARIAAVVEASLFGGSPVDERQWSACRTAYSDFAEKRVWSR